MAIILSTDEQQSFDGRFRRATVSGPFSLFRLCGRNAAGAASNRYGRFWFNPKFFFSMIDVISDRASNTAQLNHYLRFLLREYTAVCYDWNNFASIYELNVPAGTSLEVVVGRIAPKPFYSRSDPARRTALPHEVLVGGEFQYVIDIQNDDARKNLVKGPRPLWLSRGGNA